MYVNTHMYVFFSLSECKLEQPLERQLGNMHHTVWPKISFLRTYHTNIYIYTKWGLLQMLVVKIKQNVEKYYLICLTLKRTRPALRLSIGSCFKSTIQNMCHLYLKNVYACTHQCAYTKETQMLKERNGNSGSSWLRNWERVAGRLIFHYTSFF